MTRSSFSQCGVTAFFEANLITLAAPTIQAQNKRKPRVFRGNLGPANCGNAAVVVSSDLLTGVLPISTYHCIRTPGTTHRPHIRHTQAHDSFGVDFSPSHHHHEIPRTCPSGTVPFDLCQRPIFLAGLGSGRRQSRPLGSHYFNRLHPRCARRYSASCDQSRAWIFDTHETPHDEGALEHA